jgi:hypothetical protein
MSNDGQKQSKPDQGRQKKKRRRGMCLVDRPILENTVPATEVAWRSGARSAQAPTCEPPRRQAPQFGVLCGLHNSGNLFNI